MAVTIKVRETNGVDYIILRCPLRKGFAEALKSAIKADCGVNVAMWYEVGQYWSIPYPHKRQVWNCLRKFYRGHTLVTENTETVIK